MVLLATKLVPWSSTQLCYVIFDVSTHVSNTFSTADRNFCSHHQAHDDLAFSGQEDIAGVLSPFWSYPLRVRACSVMSDSLRPHGLQQPRFLCPWDFSSKNTGVGCHFFHQGIFLTQQSNSCLLLLLHWQADSLPLSHQGSPSSYITLNLIKTHLGISPFPLIIR